MSLPLIGEGFAFGAAVCWAIGPLIAYRGVEALGTFRFSQFRYTTSALILLILAATSRSIDFSDGRSIGFLVIFGVLGVALGEAALFQAVFLLGPRMASIIFSLHAPITAFLGAAIFSEKISALSFVGVILAVVGVYTAIIFRANSERAGGEWYKSGKVELGLMFAALAVVFQVIGALLAKEVIPNVNPFFASFLRTGSAAVAFFPLFLIMRDRSRTVEAIHLRFVLYSALVSTVGGMTFLLAAFAYTAIFRAVVVASLAPVLYILIMSILRRERFPLGAWLGTLAAFCGVILTIANV